MRIIPIASGKGGVGKSLIAANLAIALGQAGKSVFLADLDLGGSNLHMILGLRPRREGLGAFLSRPGAKFEDAIMETDYPNLRFIPGDSEIPGLANLAPGQKSKAIRNLRSLQADYLIMDLGAGTSFNILDFFLMSRRGLIITTPAPTATVNAYLFLKNAAFRLLQASFKRHSPAWVYLEGLKKDGAALQRIYIPQIIESVKTRDPESYASYLERVSRFRPRLVLNMLENPEDGDKAGRLRRSCREYLDMDMEHLGIVYRDDIQDTALRSRLPILIYKPLSVLSQAILRIADKLIQTEADPEDDFPAGGYLEETYQTARMEAEVDFNAKIDYIEELLQSGP